MSIPKYDEMYRAFLNCLADGRVHKSKEVKDLVASVFSISEKGNKQGIYRIKKGERIAQIILDLAK